MFPPRGPVFQYSVEDDQPRVQAGGQGHLLSFPRGTETLRERPLPLVG